MISNSNKTRACSDICTVSFLQSGTANKGHCFGNLFTRNRLGPGFRADINVIIFTVGMLVLFLAQWQIHFTYDSLFWDIIIENAFLNSQK